MGIFSFIKNAGAKVFGIGKTTEEEATEKASKLKNAINALEFKIVNLSIEVKDDSVIIWGEADSQSTKERLF